MSTGDPVCPHNKWLANCGTCVTWRNAGKNPYEMFQKSQLWDEGLLGDFIAGGLEPMTKKNHKPDVDPAVLAEHQAKIEWEALQQTVTELRKTFLSLPIEFRQKVLTDVCMYCLQESRGPCYCNNDE